MRFEKKVTVAGTTTLYHRYVYRGYLQIAALDLTRSAQPDLWLVTWDPSQATATRPLAIQKDGTWFTYGYDITKNVCEVFGKNGYIRTTYSYAPFGNVSVSENGVAQPFQWSSEHYDPELDLVYYNFRHYSPTLGRFLSRDPVAEQGGLNLYAYVENRTTHLLDSRGLSWGSLIPPGLCSYVCSKIPNTQLPCCNGEIYDPSKYCCKKKDGRDTLIERKTETIYFVTLHGRLNIDDLLQHAWLEGFGVPNGSAGFYPRDNSIKVTSFPGVVKSPDPAKDNQEGFTLTKTETILNSCDYNLNTFSLCISSMVYLGDNVPYFVVGFNCHTWATFTMSTCLRLAKL